MIFRLRWFHRSHPSVQKGSSGKLYLRHLCKKLRLKLKCYVRYTNPGDKAHQASHLNQITWLASDLMRTPVYMSTPAWIIDFPV